MRKKLNSDRRHQISLVILLLAQARLQIQYFLKSLAQEPELGEVRFFMQSLFDHLREIELALGSARQKWDAHDEREIDAAKEAKRERGDMEYIRRDTKATLRALKEWQWRKPRQTVKYE